MFKVDGTRRDFPLTKPRTVVGRKNTCELRIPLTSVSRQHVEIMRENDGETYRLRDLGSSNGTYHNGSRVQEATLAAGDEIIVGPVVFTVTVDGEPAEIRPVRTILQESAEVDEADDRPMPLMTPSMDIPATIEAEQHSPTVDLDDPTEMVHHLDELAAAIEMDEDDDR